LPLISLLFEQKIERADPRAGTHSKRLNGPASASQVHSWYTERRWRVGETLSRGNQLFEVRQLKLNLKLFGRALQRRERPRACILLPLATAHGRSHLGGCLGYRQHPRGPISSELRTECLKTTGKNRQASDRAVSVRRLAEQCESFRTIQRSNRAKAAGSLRRAAMSVAPSTGSDVFSKPFLRGGGFRRSK
jgi:hypothetical protein